MQVSFNKLQQQLKQRLDPLYFITGSELLLVEESCDLIVIEARAQGFTEVVWVEITRTADWYSLLADASARSLFAEKRLFDVRLPRNVFDVRRTRSSVFTPEVQTAIKTWVSERSEETFMILRGCAWDYRCRTAAWFKSISSLATTVILETVPTAKIAQWIDGRARSLGLILARDAVTELADLTDGNLYAAQQELEKLKLIYLNENKSIGVEELSRINWSISGVFDLIDTACVGNISRLSTMLAAVRRDGTEPLSLVGALASQLRKYHDLACERRTYLTPNRRRIGETVIKRIGRIGLERLLIECAYLDYQQKGILHGDSWLALESLLLNLAGKQNRTLTADAKQLRIDYEHSA